MSIEREVMIGEGIHVNYLRLGPVKEELYAGRFALDPAASNAIVRTHDCAGDYADENRRSELQTLLRRPEYKGFRNAYTSIVIERAWDSYLDATTGGQLYKVAYTADGDSALAKIQDTAGMSASGIVRVIEDSEEAVLSHFICSQFYDGRIPMISGDPEKDRQYHEEFKKQTDLDAFVTSNPSIVPESAGSESVFITSGILLARTHIFGMPELIDQVTAHDGIKLSTAQHKSCLERTLRSVVYRHYLPTTAIASVGIMPLLDSSSRELDPTKWTVGGEEESLLAYPASPIIEAANARLRSLTNLPAETHCPAFSARVRRPGSGETVHFAKALQEHAMNQFNLLYYPRRDDDMIHI